MFSLLLPYEDGRRRRTRAAHSHHYTVGIVSEKNKVLMQFLLTYGDRKLARAFVSRFPIRRSTRPPPTMGGRACRASSGSRGRAWGSPQRDLADEPVSLRNPRPSRAAWAAQSFVALNRTATQGSRPCRRGNPSGDSVPRPARAAAAS